jgi:parallel beta-helix repeat protein
MDEEKGFSWKTLLAILVTIAGILGSVVTIINSFHAPVIVPQIDVFNSIPPEIIDGGEATLSWSVSGGKDAKVSIDRDIGEQPLIGTATVHPNKTTDYTLTAINSEGKSDSQTATVIVWQKNALSPSQSSIKEMADEAPIIVVDQMGRGDYPTITQAIDAAINGSKIIIRKGVYNEGIIIDKSLEIVGDGNLGDVVIRAKGAQTILFKAVNGVISNMMIEQNGGGDWFGMDISEGCLELRGCDITSDSLSCIGVHNDAYPKLIGNKIHNGKQSGIYIYGDAEGLIDGNDIYGNTLSGILIKDKANPTISNNKIHDSSQDGIYIYGDAEGRIEGNDIYGNTVAGIEIANNANPTISNNKIHDSKQSGVYIYGDAKGQIEGNDIYGNALAGIEIIGNANPAIIDNEVHDGKQCGILIDLNGKGTIEENQIYGNSMSGIIIRDGGNPVVMKNVITNNKYYAIFIYNNAGGTFESNNFSGNEISSWSISEDSESNVIKSENSE